MEVGLLMQSLIGVMSVVRDASDLGRAVVEL